MSSGDDSGLTGLRSAPPEEVQSGETVRLPCDYELGEGVILHSVKWYRNDQKFFRYVPKDVPPFRIFPLPGLHIDVSRRTKYLQCLQFKCWGLILFVVHEYIYIYIFYFYLNCSAGPDRRTYSDPTQGWPSLHWDLQVWGVREFHTLPHIHYLHWASCQG